MGCKHNLLHQPYQCAERYQLKTQQPVHQAGTVKTAQNGWDHFRKGQCHPISMENTQATTDGIQLDSPLTQNRSRELELIHARWCMLGALGCLVPELLQKYAGLQFG